MTRKLLKRDERVASILAAAARAFGVGGFAATSMEDIAAEAGVTKLIIYRHFDSKQALYERVLDETRERLAEALRFRDRAPAPDMIGQLLAAARAEPAAFALLFRHAAREPQFASYVAGFRDRALAAALRGIPESVPDDLRRWTAALSFSVVVDGIVLWLDEGSPDRDAEVTDRLRSLTAAIVTAGSPPTT
ncbi:TetR/AcrR family transcriptional regulator [Dactylosporangium sp. NPDC051541]|uniref:TetR/AcrR family transcriptional regulator n=1 Tax=Dactylosporangium sp. NPDC051541 TaxID=3363977 RepID=UPI0037BA6A97